MKKIDFKVTFLSDIILHASSNTQGNIEVLDYITGASFLGMVAKNYDDFENSFEVFHSGKVRFGEASPLFENKATYKTPFCFFKPKLDFDSKDVYNNHFIDYTNTTILDKQLKQIRSGYISSDLDSLDLEYVYSQKAAYDKELRRSKDASMFGYKAIKKGITWKFTISLNDIDEKTEKQILENILGEKYLGKSKTSQYGKVLIERFDNFKEENIENLTLTETTYVYINSSIALFDENAMPTFELSKDNLGLKDAIIDWTQTQIRTKTFTPYNYTRQTNDYSRLVIERGSVIALLNASNEDINNLKNGIGAYLSEGYGEVLINPTFLLKKENFSFNKQKIKYEDIKTISDKKDENLISFLTYKRDLNIQTYSLGTKVQIFIKDNKNKFEKVSKSQWGQIRMIVQFNENKNDYKEKIINFITHGTSKKQWENGQKKLEEILKDENIEFIKLLSIMMPKVKMEEEK